MIDLMLKIYIIFWMAIIGAVLGSFLECMAVRWARGESLTEGRSHCDSCNKPLTTWDLIPIMGYLTHRGRCSHCGAKIPVECLMAELAGAIGLACLGWTFGAELELAQWTIFTILLLAVSLTDVQRQVIPDKLLLAMAVNRVVWIVILQQPVSETVKGILVSACAGPLPLLILVLLLDKLMGRETMGGGDIKLLLTMALYVNWAQILLTLLAGCLLGLLAAAVRGKKRAETIPFGPFLAAGCVLSVCFGNPLITWYLGLLG